MWNNYGRDRQVIDENTIPRMRIACWVTKATNTHSEYVIPTVFHSNEGYAKAAECYVYPYNAPAHKLSAKLYDIYNCCVYSENLLMMDRGTV
jgi:hypothetical protein